MLSLKSHFVLISSSVRNNLKRPKKEWGVGGGGGSLDPVCMLVSLCAFNIDPNLILEKLGNTKNPGRIVPAKLLPFGPWLNIVIPGLSALIFAPWSWQCCPQESQVWWSLVPGIIPKCSGLRTLSQSTNYIRRYLKYISLEVTLSRVMQAINQSARLAKN